MRLIELQQNPNQSLSVRLENWRFTIGIKQGNGTMLVDCDCENETLIKAQRLIANTPILPYKRLEKFGNFILLSENDALPDWQQFGKNQRLIYLSPIEIAATLS